MGFSWLEIEGLGRRHHPCSPTPSSLLNSGWAEESGFYLPPKMPEESGGQAQSGEPVSGGLTKVYIPPSFLESQVKALEGRLSGEALRR